MTLVGDVARAGLTRAIKVPAVQGIPAGQRLTLPGRGATYVTELPGPHPEAPTVVLLHALATTAALCWYPLLEDVARTHRVVAFDQRWHGRGIHSPRFRLDDCADDVAAVLDALGIEQALVAGYSMGSAVAQLVWRRHPERVAGLVLSAATRNFRCATRERVFFPALGAAMVPLHSYAQRRAQGWAAALPELPALGGANPEWGRAEFRSTSAWSLPEVLAEIGRFNSAPWVADIDVPTSVVATTRDHTIPLRRQLRLAGLIPGAEVFTVQAGHGAVVLAADRFRPAFLEALASVQQRSAVRRLPRARSRART